MRPRPLWVSSARKTMRVDRDIVLTVYAAMRCATAIAWPAPMPKPVSLRAAARRSLQGLIRKIFVRGLWPATDREVVLREPRETAVRKTMSAFPANVKMDFARPHLVEMPRFKLGKTVMTAIPLMMAMAALKIAAEMMSAAMASQSHFTRFAMMAM